MDERAEKCTARKEGAGDGGPRRMEDPERVVVVTGAGSGVGRATALELARCGGRVVLAGRRPEGLAETARLLAGSGAEVLTMSTDVTSSGSVKRLFDGVREAFGRVDVLFNNAGITAPAVPFEDIELSDWEAVVMTNLTGAFLCAREAVRVMKTQTPGGGRIINNGSVSAHSPRPKSAAYTASKHAITGLTKSIALDGRPYGIACGQVDIGNADTELTRSMAKGVLQADGTVRAEPRMDVGDVARAVRYMASLPLGANVMFMTVMATGMPFVGRG